MMATLLAGCGGTSPGTDVKVTGAWGRNPVVSIPKANPDNQLVVRTVVKGSGPQLAQNDVLVGNYVGYVWSGTKSALKVDTFKQSTPELFPPGGQLLKGLKKALVGQPDR